MGENNTKSLWLPVAGLIFAMLLWGSSFVVMKFALGACEPYTIMFGRMAVASVVFLLFRRHFGKIEYRPGDWKFLGLMALCEPCLYFTFETHALRLTSACEAAMITALLPLMTMIAARWTLGESLSVKALFGLALAISGTIGLTFFGRASENAPFPIWGNGLELLAMVCATGYTISCRYLSRRYSPFFLTAIQAFIGAVFFMPALLITPGNTASGVTLPVLVSIIYLGAIVNVVAYFLYNYGLCRIPASQVSPYVNLIPVFSMILGWMILDEQLTGLQYASAALVLGGTFTGQGVVSCRIASTRS